MVYEGMETIEKLDYKQRGGHTEDTKSVPRTAAVPRGPLTSVLVRRTVGFVQLLNMTLMRIRFSLRLSYKIQDDYCMEWTYTKSITYCLSKM